MEMRSVYSDAVDEIGYDDETKELHVVWKRNGRRSVYSGVPPEVAEETMNAPSVGQALRNSVQNTYAHGYKTGETDGGAE